MFQFIRLGITPTTWKKYRVPPRISAMQWMSDFVARLKQLDKLATLTTNEGVQSLRVRTKRIRTFILITLS